MAALTGSSGGGVGEAPPLSASEETPRPPTPHPPKKLGGGGGGGGDFLCSCCGEKTPRAKKKSIGRAHVAIASCVARGFVAHLDSKFPLFACTPCSAVASSAAKMARFCFPDCAYFKQQNGRSASEATSVISSNRTTLRAALAEFDVLR